MHGTTCIFWANLTPFSLQISMEAGMDIELCQPTDMRGLAFNRTADLVRIDMAVKLIFIPPCLFIWRITSEIYRAHENEFTAHA